MPGPWLPQPRRLHDHLSDTELSQCAFQAIFLVADPADREIVRFVSRLDCRRNRLGIPQEGKPIRSVDRCHAINDGSPREEFDQDRVTDQLEGGRRITLFEARQHGQRQQGVADRARMDDQHLSHRSAHCCAWARSAGVLMLKNERSSGSTSLKAASGIRCTRSSGLTQKSCTFRRPASSREWRTGRQVFAYTACMGWSLPASSGMTMSPDSAWSSTTRIAAGESHGMSLAAAKTRSCAAKCRPVHSPPRVARTGLSSTTTLTPSDMKGSVASATIRISLKRPW